METKLNNNEVTEIAKMQQKIDSYESFIKALHTMIKFKKTDLNYLLFEGVELTSEMNTIWRFIKETIKKTSLT